MLVDIFVDMVSYQCLIPYQTTYLLSYIYIHIHKHMHIDIGHNHRSMETILLATGVTVKRHDLALLRKLWRTQTHYWGVLVISQRSAIHKRNLLNLAHIHGLLGEKKRGNPIYNSNNLEKYKSVGIMIPNIWKNNSKPPARCDGKHDFLTWNLQTESDPRALDAIIPIHLFHFLKV